MKNGRKWQSTGKSWMKKCPREKFPADIIIKMYISAKLYRTNDKKRWDLNVFCAYKLWRTSVVKSSIQPYVVNREISFREITADMRLYINIFFSAEAEVNRLETRLEFWSTQAPGQILKGARLVMSHIKQFGKSLIPLAIFFPA